MMANIDLTGTTIRTFRQDSSILWDGSEFGFKSSGLKFTYTGSPTYASENTISIGDVVYIVDTGTDSSYIQRVWSGDAAGTFDDYVIAVVAMIHRGNIQDLNMMEKTLSELTIASAAESELYDIEIYRVGSQFRTSGIYLGNSADGTRLALNWATHCTGTGALVGKASLIAPTMGASSSPYQGVKFNG